MHKFFVPIERARLGEPFVAERAGVLFDPGVHDHVLLELAARRADLRTQRAGEQLTSRVHLKHQGQDYESDIKYYHAKIN